MKYHIAGLLVVTALIVILLFATQSRRTESFQDATANAVCPTSAERGPDGKIHVNPGNKTFNTLPEYVNYLSGLYTNGASCIPPVVKKNSEPVAGILGGLGTGSDDGRTVFTSDLHTENASVNTPVNKLDDYEYTRVFQLEDQKRNTISVEEKSKFMNERITDWANLPFNSEERAKQEEEFIAGRMDAAYRDPKTGVLFETMEGQDLQPPDVEAARLREQQVLAAYRPTDVSKHIVDNETEAVARLVMASYAADKNWEPVVTKTGENRWEVTELRPKPQKERYADGTTANVAMMDSTKTRLPAPTIDFDDRIRDDPYFDKSAPQSEQSKYWNYHDFKEWTPGLERMFAPTADNKAWY
jgi:hypothetical protein